MQLAVAPQRPDAGIERRRRRRPAAREAGKQAVTFLKKSNQKTFAHCGRWRWRCQRPQDQSFLLLFFKKEALPSSKKPKPAPPGRGPARLYTADF